MAWHRFSSSQAITWPCRHSKNIFSPKLKNFGAIWKIIWFWSTFNKKARAYYDVTKRYRMSRFVKLGTKNCKIKLLGSVQQSITVFFDFLLWKMVLLSVENYSWWKLKHKLTNLEFKIHNFDVHWRDRKGNNVLY